MSGKPLTDVVEEAKRVLKASADKGIILRLLGGLAIRLHCPSATHRSLKRKYPDIDLVGLSKQGELIEKLFDELGYIPNKKFNALHGTERLQFGEMINERIVDIILDKFKMCHKLDLRKRLEIDDLTVSLADLLLTKMQVIKLNEKDVRDVIALLRDHELGNTDHDQETINVDYIAIVCSKDWGWYKTISTNLRSVLQLLPSYRLKKSDEEEVTKKIDQILKSIEEKPKSMKWKLRDLIGEKMKWWTEVEEVVR